LAIAIAGKMWPPVPPVAKTSLMLDSHNVYPPQRHRDTEKI
jgi:hypothetical protein